MNWQKTKVQASGSREDKPSTPTVLGQEVPIVEEFLLPWLPCPHNISKLS